MLASLLDHYRKHGLISTSLKILKGVLYRLQWLVYRKDVDVFYEKDLNEELKVNVPDRLTLEDVHKVGLDTLVSFIREHHVDYKDSIKRIKYYFKHGYYGRVALLDGEIIGYRWWLDHTMNNPYLSFYKRNLEEDEVFGMDLYIAPDFRDNNSGLELAAKCLQCMREQGYTKMLTMIQRANKRSIWLFTMLGWKEIERRELSLFFSFLLYTKGMIRLQNPLWFSFTS